MAEQPIDKTLRGMALRRATDQQLPRTLTAHEWEDYYRAHGRPAEHQHSVDGPGLWARLLQWSGLGR
jgi:hypothetical protein